MPRDLTKIYGEIIYFGVLNKTKISENGKKLRKNWTPAFAVLTESYLFFFKDAKSFQNMVKYLARRLTGDSTRWGVGEGDGEGKQQQQRLLFSFFFFFSNRKMSSA